MGKRDQHTLCNTVDEGDHESKWVAVLISGHVIPAPPVERSPVEAIENGKQTWEHYQKGQICSAIIVFSQVMVD